MLLYSETITARVRFITEFIGNELYGEAFGLTSDRQAFLDHKAPKINYSHQLIEADEYRLAPHTLLFEKDIHHQSVDCFEWEGAKAFFRTASDFPFDIFAASFYLMSRYEEYLPHKNDMYGRYAHENSLAFREGFLSIPLVNIWLSTFRLSLQKKYPEIKFKSSSFTILPTYDIDEAWSYKHKNTTRKLGARIRNFIKGEKQVIRERNAVLAGILPDPFESYEWMDALHRQYKIKPRYFFLVAEMNGKYDRHILPGEKAMQQLIKDHADKYEMGIHPSWQTGDDHGLLQTEIRTLEDLSGKKIASSRQHFIRFNLPDTFRRLLKAGIREDFSMGYGSINGFRASVASPFYWYDLEKDQQTELLLYPFCFMEANAFYEQKLNPAEALEEMRAYYKQVKNINGTFIMIWHNTFLGTGTSFAGWRDAYEKFIREISS